MKKKRFMLLAILLVVALTLAACGGDEEGSEETAGTTSGNLLQTVTDRGQLVCGSRTDLAGFGYLDDAGNNLGFDVDLCRAVAAAVLGDGNAVEFVPLTADERGPALQTGEVDLLSRNVTWTSTRDAQWGNFTIIMFYDGQGFMVPADSGITSLDDMDGATVCVTSGTTTETNLADAFRERGLSFTPVVFEDTATVYGTSSSNPVGAAEIMENVWMVPLPLASLYSNSPLRHWLQSARGGKLY